MPILFPLIIGGAGMLGLGATAGVVASDGAEKMANVLKWTVIGALGLGAVIGTVYIARRI